MGKLTNNLELLDRGYIGTHRSFPDDSLLSDIMVMKDEIKPSHLPRSKQYVVQTRFAVSQIIPESDDADEWNHIYTHMMKVAKDTIINAVYGEFREPLLQVMVDLRHKGMEKQFQALDKIYRDMFEV